MTAYKHCALNLSTGEIITTEKGHTLKRLVALTNKRDAKHYGNCGKTWIFDHNHGKKFGLAG